jgi:hypothetical protein
VRVADEEEGTMRRIRRMLAVGGVAALAGAALVTVLPATSGAGGEAGLTIIVRKVVDGPATSGTTVTVECTDPQEPIEATLNFDATGAPTTSEGGFVENDGAWAPFGGQPDVGTTCTFVETDAEGAASTSWTCAFDAQFGTEPEGLGCAAEAGADTGPVTIVYGGNETEPEHQEGTVVFTNTYEEPLPPEVAPSFTG